MHMYPAAVKNCLTLQALDVDHQGDPSGQQPHAVS